MSRLNLGPITAYAIAVKHGFEGTEEEWLASLKGNVTVDAELSETSENPLQNKVITKALNEKVDKVIEETETAKNKAEIALISAEQAEQNAKAYADEKLADKVDYETFGQAIGSVRTESKNYTDLMCNGANKAVSFVNYSSMIEGFKGIILTDPSTSPYNIGQNVMIVTLEVPDLWVSDFSPQYIDYNYTSDTDFVNELKANGSVQVGNYVFSALETQKVDLTDYAEMAYVDNHKMPIPTNSVKDNEYVITYNPAKNVSSVNTLVKASASGTEAPYPLSFVKVNEYGQFTTADPIGDYHCANKKYIDDKIGDIETALDELHNYAQSLISGGKSE